MKEVPLSLCERSALLESLKSQIRLDGRDFMDIRNIEINFGKDYGCCTVSLGETRVLSQVTCEVVEPRPSRPNEGKLSIAAHLSPMAAPHFEQGKGNDIIDEIQQVLDRNIKESRCVDLESLCIMAEESVWQFKVDVTVLNHGGNLGDACNLSAVAALRHFHRPDVTVEEDGRVTIHTHEERELIPTFLKKIPVCLTYALFGNDDGFITILDPTEKEERVMSGKLVVGLNPHGEITSLLLPGKLCLDKDYIMLCVKQAFSRAKNIAETVMAIVEEDLEKRKTSIKVDGYLNCLTSDTAYNKKLIMNKINKIQCMEVKVDVKGKNEIEQVKEGVSNHQETTLGKKGNKKGVNEKVIDRQDSSSEEEFSAELLSKTLPEIKEVKKKTKSKKKKIKNESKDDVKESKKKIKNVNRDDDDTETIVTIDESEIY